MTAIYNRELTIFSEKLTNRDFKRRARLQH